MTNIVFAGRGIRPGLTATALCLSLACTSALAQTAAESPAAQAAATTSASIRLVGVIWALPAGSTWLSVGQGTLCLSPATQVAPGGRTAVNLPAYTDFFKTGLEATGYKVITPE